MASMASQALLAALALLLCSSLSAALYEDQVGLADWHHKYIGKVKEAIFHTQKAGRKRVVVSTEENIVASLDLRTGNIYWRHVLGESDVVDRIDVALEKYVITLSSGGSVLRAWNLPDGQMIWESRLQVSKHSKPLLYVPASPQKNDREKEHIIFVFGGGYLYAVSSIDGEVIWKREFALESLHVQEAIHPTSNTIFVAGFLDSSHVIAYEVNTKNGEVLNSYDANFDRGFYGEALPISSGTLVALNVFRSSLVLVNFHNGAISFHQTDLSNLIDDFSGTATLLPSKLSGMFAVKTETCVVLVRFKGMNELEMIKIMNKLSSLSHGLLLTEGHQAFAVVEHLENKVHVKVHLSNDMAGNALEETFEVDRQRGQVEKIFINNYVRTDRSHGFRVLMVMEDHSLLLFQQGEVVWTREDGLASIIDSITSELPFEKDGVSVSKVEHDILKWLKGHMLKLKGALMLASPDDKAVIQEMRLQNSERNKMTRDHNGFRKLIIVLTKAGKILALHTGDGRVVWSLLLPALRKLETCQYPTALNIFQWHVPHHHAMDENPSLLVSGRCGQTPDAPGFLSIVDSYTGRELSSMILGHSIVQVIPLPLKDSKELSLHFVLDDHSCAHLYPQTPDARSVFKDDMRNVYLYSVASEKNKIRGLYIHGKCDIDISDEYCFITEELWSIVFPSETEKIAITARRKMNEVVHTQAKIVSEKDVMYKYISKNLIFVATVSPKAAGEIGSATPDEAWLNVYLIDAVTGRILHRVNHQGAQGPMHAVISENWVVYHYFNLRAHRYEMSVIEIYDQSRADNKDVWKLIVGKHNLTSPVTAYSRPEVAVKFQTYFFTHSVKFMAVTATAKGITAKQLLIGTIGDQILALDKRFLDPRRSANPSQAEREEGIIPLTDTLPIVPQSYITHSLRVEGLRGIVALPAKLESTALVFAYGVDLFFTRLAPSRTYDSLTEDFSYALLLATIVALVAAIFATWALSEKKELREKWR